MNNATINSGSKHFVPKCDSCNHSPGLDEVRCKKCDNSISFTYDTSLPIFDNSKVGLSRFWSRLPLVHPEKRVTLGEGNTPLLKMELHGFTNVFIKNEMGNPTGSHKDRQLSIGISHAVTLGKLKSVLVSAGSTGLANAAYCARAGIKSIVFTGESARGDRVYPIHILGSEVIRVNLDIDSVIDELDRICMLSGIYNCSTARSNNPYQAEGPKTIAFEIFEQLGSAPDWMIIPTGGGGTYAAIGRGFIELFEAGLIAKVPRLVGAVPTTYNALEHGHNAGYTTMAEIKRHNIGEGIPTILAKLAHIYPPDAQDALQMAHSVKGHFLSATDEESLTGLERLASSIGLYSEPSSGTGYAVMDKFLASGLAKKTDKIVVLVCGSGFRETVTVSEKRPFKPELVEMADMMALISKQ
jgi:threonine synthase